MIGINCFVRHLNTPPGIGDVLVSFFSEYYSSNGTHTAGGWKVEFWFFPCQRTTDFFIVLAVITLSFIRQLNCRLIQEPEDKELLEHLVKQHPNLTTLVELAHTFLELLRQRQADAFDSWLMKALSCQIKPLTKFAAGLMDDYAEVKASMMSEVSNGPVEGLNNKLKMLKRQMYGRAGLELLTKRFIMAA